MKCTICGSDDMYVQSNCSDTCGQHITYKCPHCNCIVTIDIDPIFRGSTTFSYNVGDYFYSVS